MKRRRLNNDSMIDDINIDSINKLITPSEVINSNKLDNICQNRIYTYRQDIENILNGYDKRLLIIVGPCSIHEKDGALDYARRLKEIAEKYQKNLYIIMRVYFEKPRTTVGWKGLIYDPSLDESNNINYGLKLSREIMIEITKIGLPIATEFLDTIIPQYISDLVSYGAIGARTTESQLHRQLASGLSMPIGFKNSSSGDIEIALDAIVSAQHRHCFPGIDKNGNVSIINTKGNSNGHLVLRGGNNKPNYKVEDITDAINKMKSKSIKTNIIVDCSHGNSRKDYRNQIYVCRDLMDCAIPNRYIKGIMIESNIKSGNQKLNGLAKLEYGVSVTDSCIDINATELIFSQLNKLLN